MTSLLSPPDRPSLDAPPAAPGSSVLVGVLAALSAAALGLLAVVVPVLVVWLAEDRSGTDLLDAVRSGVLAWLVAHGTPLQLAHGTLGVWPLGLALLPAALLHRAGRRTAERLGAGAARATALVAVPYAGATGIAAAVVETPSAHPPAAAAAWWGLLLAVVAAGLGAARAAGSPPVLAQRLPEPVRPVLRAAACALGVVLAAAALLVAVALARDLPDAAAVAEASAPGAVGGLGLLALGVALAPNAVVWAAAWLVGEGFAVGTGTAVTPFDVAVGPLPALPLTAALPDAAPPGWAGVLAVLVPVVAGAVGGRVLHRSTAALPVGRALLAAVGTGAAAGLALGVLAAVSAGSAGSGRLAELGPSAGAVAVLVAAEVALGAAVAVLLARRGAEPAAA